MDISSIMPNSQKSIELLPSSWSPYPTPVPGLVVYPRAHTDLETHKKLIIHVFVHYYNEIAKEVY